MKMPAWFEKPETGKDWGDTRALRVALNALDTISAEHRTDAFRLLASRYEADLRRMQQEDAAKQRPTA